MSNGRTPRRRTGRKINAFRLALVVGFFAALVMAGAGAGMLLFSVKDLPAWDPKALELSLPTYIYDKDGKEAARIYVENRVPVKLDEVPEDIINAFLATEDVRFYDHNGIDVRRIAGALIADVKAASKVQGASTITQQLIKRSFLTPDKAWKRKIQEIILAIQIERKYTKDEIFEMYLNQIYFGEGAYGIQSAAEIYFGKDITELTLAENALLAGLPKAPSRWDPYKNMEAAVGRRNVVLDNMVRFEKITKEQAAKAKEEKVTLSGTRAIDIVKYKYPYFVDYITEFLVAKYGEDTVYKSGLKVYTTLDPKIQANAEAALANDKLFPKSKPDKNGIDQPQAAAVVIDPHTGHIKALVGGRDHTQKRQFNRAVDAVRQPGSSFKPIIAYAPAIERGMSPASVVDDSQTKFGEYEYKNYDGKFRGLITYREAIIASINVAAVKILQENGISKSIKFARKLGISTLMDKQDENLGIALGGLTKGITPLELAGAYGTFANEGVYIEPIAVLEVKDKDGNILDKFKPTKQIAMSKTTAFIITDMMQSAVTSGTGRGALISGRSVAGKTGTTSDYKDAWFAGYTPELTAIVWMGHDEPKTMSGVTGGSYPARIWREIMSNSLKDVPVLSFQQPEGIVTETVCSLSGKKPGLDCSPDELVTDMFVENTVPTDICTDHIPVKICTETGQLANAGCPSTITKSLHQGQQPTETCTLHNPNNKITVFAVCTDPSHGSLIYKANIAGQNQEGGCPIESIKYMDFSGQAEPASYCTLPEHQLRPKPPIITDSPTVPEVSIPITIKPQNPKPN